MSVRVGEETFILPLNHVTESLQPQADQIYSVAGNERVMQVRGEYLPLVEMHRVFSVGQAQADPTQAIAVIMQAEERRFALLVDHLVGQHQVVVKNLESNYRKGAWHFGRHHPGRRQRGADRGRIRAGARQPGKVVPARSHSELTERHIMAAKPHTQATRAEDVGNEFLVFTLGEEEYGIDILKVQEIRGYDAATVTRIANVPSFIKGVTNLRGIIVPIVDLRIKFNLGSVEYNEQTVVIILNLDRRVVGIVVDGVSDVLMLNAAQVRPAPEFGATLSTEYLTGLGTVDERMLILVDIEKLMTSDEMALVEKVAS